MRAKRIETIAIPLEDRFSIELCNITYAPKCDSNLISLRQLCDISIIYIDNAKAMTLMQSRYPIAHIRQDQNLFILDLITPNRAMLATRPRRPTYLVSKNKKVRVWYHRFDYASNAKIIRALKLFMGIKSFDNAYNIIEIYSNSKQFDLDNNYNQLKYPNSSNDNYANYPKHFNNSMPVHAKKTYSFIPSAKTSALSSPLNNDFDSLCTPYIASKQTRIVINNKLMIEVKEKLEEVYVNLWGPHFPPSLLEKTYAALLLDAKIQKSCVMYLQSKYEFVNTIQI